MARFILNKHAHELILHCQQLLNADRRAWWRRVRWIAMWGVPTTTPTTFGFLGGSSKHHLQQVTYTIRYCNSLVECDVSNA
jgi:hypothetical protein